MFKIAIGEFGEILRCQEIVFGAANVAENRARVILLIVKPELPEDVSDKRRLLAGVENSEVSIKSCADCAEFLDILAENAGTCGVECRYPQISADAFCHEFVKPFLHLVRRFVGKGDGEDAEWGDTPGL